MVKEMLAREARSIAFNGIPETLLEEILTKIKKAATKGKLNVIVDISNYYDNVWHDNLRLDSSIHLLKAKIKSLGYFCEVNPPLPKEKKMNPDIVAAWIKIEW